MSFTDAQVALANAGATDSNWLSYTIMNRLGASCGTLLAEVSEHLFP
jgi:hypothetical protein